MKILSRLFLLFTVTTAVELYLLVKLTELTSLWVTLAMIVVPGLLGAWLMRREGTRALRSIKEALGLRREPGGVLLDGAILLVAGALLLTPGVLTDLVGLMLLVPPVRSRVRDRLARRIQKAVDRTMAEGRVSIVGFGPRTEVIDADEIRRP